MKRQKLQYLSKIAGAFCGALAVSLLSAVAATTTNVFTFDSGVAGWALPAWGGQGGGSAWDGTQDHTGNSGGSLHVIADWSAGDQLVDLGWYSGSAWWNNPATVTDLSLYTNVSLWVKLDVANTTIPLSTFNSTGESLRLWAIGDSFAWIDLGSAAIPNSASNGWVKINVPIDPTTPGIATTYGLGLKKWTGNGNIGVTTFWVDDLTLDAAPFVPPPPTVSLRKPVTGLNLFAPTGPYNRENIKTINAGSFIGKGNTPVTYSFTIKQGVDGSAGAQFQTHLFLIPNPGTETAPDWNEPNVIFADLESTTNGGAQWTFRYKTNLPGGNSMIYDTNVVPASIGNTTMVGTWTLTFLNDTNITMTTPSGSSTNFSIPNDSAQLFASPLTAYFGVQAGNTAGIGKQTVFSHIKITGADNALDDNFLTDSVLDTNTLWNVVAVDPQGVIQIASDAAYWVNWTVPDAGFSLIGSSSLLGGWSDLPGVTATQMGGLKWALVHNSQLPSMNTSYFRLIKRQFTQLQVLLPGETNAPGTLTGKVGTPDPQTVGNPVTVKIHSVDSTFHIVNSTDVVHLTTTDGTASIDPDAGLVGGTAQIAVLFNTPGSYTVTGSDVTDPAKTNGVSSSVTVNP